MRPEAQTEDERTDRPVSTRRGVRNDVAWPVVQVGWALLSRLAPRRGRMWALAGEDLRMVKGTRRTLASHVLPGSIAGWSACERSCLIYDGGYINLPTGLLGEGRLSCNRAAVPRA